MRILSLALVLGFLLAAPGLTGTEEGTADSSESTKSAPSGGQILYRLHCGSCHGPTGTGEGPIADDLRVEPTDLTEIAKRRDGAFPREEIAQIIDGRTEIGSHGTREMPIWGLSLRDLGRGDDQEADVQSQIDLLIDYLRSIQDPPVDDAVTF